MANPRIKYLYCLISTNADLYYEQTYISISSLKMHMPSSFVSLLTDKETLKGFETRKACIKDIIDEIITVDFDESVDKIKRSRILKTTMRNKVQGDFLYIDSDTIICDDLSEINNFQYDMGAVFSEHTFLSYYSLKSETIKRRKSLLNDPLFYKNKYIFNSGVLLVRDTAFNRFFFDKWNENYQYSCSLNIYKDQPSLTLTNYQLKFPIKELNGKWNVQVYNGVTFFPTIKIFHYITTSYKEYEPFYQILPLKLKNTGYLNNNDIDIISKPLTYFGEPSFVISGEDFKLFFSNIGGFLRKLNKHKYLFNIINNVLYFLKYIFNK